jgi:hypothetical protein
VAVALLALVICCLAISNQSFWIDEAGGGHVAKQPTLATWWRAVLHHGEDLQLPLYTFFIWGWEKVVGLQEAGIRAGNALWFLPGVLVMFYALAGKPLLRWSFSTVLLCSPFVWYYLNEARPYAMQIGLSLIVFAALYQIGSTQNRSTQERGWVIALCLGSVLFGAVSLLAMLWLGAYLGAGVLGAPEDHRRRLARDYRMYWVPTLALLCAEGLFYLWTLSRGTRGAPLPATGFRNVVFVIYELLGFGGLGPGRLAIRNGGLGAFRPWVPWLAIYGVVLLIVLIQGWRQVTTFTSRRTRVCWVAALVIVVGFISIVGAKVQWRVLGRHCASAVVPVLFVLGAGVATLLSRRTRSGRIVVAAFVGLSFVSDLNLRFSERHAKEDYRSAAVIATAAAARGEHVWWCADGGAGIYYGVPMSQPNSTPAPGQVWLLVDPTERLLASQPPPQVVVYSSKIEHDPGQRLRAYLQQGHYGLSQVLPSFTIWRR